MTPERWQQVKDTFHAVLALAPDQRASFLDEVCRRDDSLRAEIESLIRAHEETGKLIDAPAYEGLAKLAVDGQELDAGETIGRYSIVSSLGRGGMGEVYLAEDSKLRRKVALKLLPPQFMVTPDRLRRFEQEAQAASALNHPNILTIYEIGETDSTRYIVTEFIDGQTLRERMTQSALDLHEALDIAIHVASALVAAHRVKIVHRDIKPENIMVRRDDGLVKVLDFGLAKATGKDSAAAPDSDVPIRPLVNTAPGMVMGTVAYMSPEQARGQTVDERTDIWSVGVVLYEMIAGKVPFAGTSANEVISEILSKDQPAPLARFSHDLPAELDRIVTKALKKDREERYQSTKDLLIDLEQLKQRLAFQAEQARSKPPDPNSPLPAAMGSQQVAFDSAGPSAASTANISVPPTASSAEYLITEIKRHKRGVVSALAMLVLLIIAGLAYSIYSARSSKVIDAMVVLPLINASGDPNTEYLADGISETLINSLTQLPQLRVVARSTAFRYKGKEIDPQAVGRELNVRAVLAGRVRQVGDTLNIQVDLVDTTTGAQLWGEEYQRKISDVLSVKQDIAREVMARLRPRLSGEEQKQLFKRDTTNAEAYQLYLLGRFYWNKYTEEGFRKSIENFKQAVEKDPAYALAYSGLADSYSLLGELSVAPPKESFPQARAYADKALVLDETLAEAHLSLGIVELLYEWEWPGAEKELRRAKELDPNNPQVYHFYGHYLQSVGRVEEAIDETKRGVKLDPTSLVINAELGWAYYCARHYDQAIAQGRKTLELDPNFVYTSWVIAQSYEQTGRYQESVAELKRARTIDANWPYIIAELGYAYAASGKRSEAEKILQQLKERAAREYIDAILIAYIYVGLGEKDQAFAWLEKAYQERSGLMPWLKGEPKWDPLRGDARFADLLRRIGLPP
jgi:serine/threonine protein kinase/Tfp pilus assembly protein PilF